MCFAGQLTQYAIVRWPVALTLPRAAAGFVPVDLYSSKTNFILAPYHVQHAGSVSRLPVSRSSLNSCMELISKKKIYHIISGAWIKLDIDRRAAARQARVPSMAIISTSAAILGIILSKPLHAQLPGTGKTQLHSTQSHHHQSSSCS